MRVVFDANIFMSSLITKNGAPYKLMQLWREEKLTLLISEPIIDELDRVIHYPKLIKLHGLSETEMAEFIQILRNEAVMVSPQETISVSSDESDNRYIECAVAGQAEYLVTGDKKHLLPIRDYEGIKIVPPSLFLALLEAGI